MYKLLRWCYLCLSVSLLNCTLSSADFSDSYKHLCAPVNKLGFSVLNRLNKQGNVVFSPSNLFKFSALVASMLSDEQGGKVWENLDVPLNQAIGCPLQTMTSSHEQGKLKSHSWILMTAAADDTELKKIANNFGTSIIPINSGGQQQALSRFHQEVSALTDKRVSKVHFSPGSTMNIYSIFYFHQYWKTPFDRCQSQSTFHNCDDTEPVEMMKCTISTHYAKRQNWTAVEVPCRDATVSMLLFINKEDSDAVLDYEIFQNLMASLRTREVYLQMPLFETDYSLPDPGSILSSLGIPASMDFQCVGMTCSDLMAAHRGYIRVNEFGAEGGDYFGFEEKGVGGSRTLKVILDRTFYFAIVRTGNVVLELGRTCMPCQPEDLLKGDKPADSESSTAGGDENQGGSYQRCIIL